MATRPEDLQNWSLWDFDEKPNFKFQTGNPTYGFGGGTVFGQQMEQNNQTGHFGMTEDGQMNLFNDDTISISGGNTKDGGTCVNIVGKNGDVSITAMKDGNILIKGSNITIDADENINILSSKNVRIKGSSSIFFDTPNLNTNAMTGNLAPRNVTFGGLVFRGTKVGQGAISNAFTGGDIGSVASELSSKAKTDLKDIAGNIDTSGLSAQANQAKSALSDALSNFGGFG
tara:strand:+ start:41 stop:727 length:687 start_codon:yes stop_codon:yes gene_type:complete